MKVSIVQMDVEWSMVRENTRVAEQMIQEAAGSDLYVLPEMWSTGFATDPRGIAESDDASLQWMRHTAGRMDAALSGSLSVYVGNTYVNRHYFVYPDGTYKYYDKHHLFGYGGEDRYYSAGERRVTAEWRGWRFLLLTCYDLRFPQWSRYHSDYDAIVLCANWPSRRAHAWDVPTRARAIEHQRHATASNRVGRDMQCEYGGDSRIVDAHGQLLTPSGATGAMVLTAEIDKESQDAYRQHFRVLDDRDCQ